MEHRLGRGLWEQTAVFSDNFFGNSRGQVVTGPFAFWPLPPIYHAELNSSILIRTLNDAGAPVNAKAAHLIYYSPNSLSHKQVTPLGTGRDVIIVDGHARLVSIEAEHNNVHNWLGGAMFFRNASPQDPCFFFHHAFIDYMWELFRRKLRKFGRNPATDYPEIGMNRKFHAAQFPMIGFEQYRNIDGYSDFFTQRIYQYESPCCKSCSQSPWTVCKFGKCVARVNKPGTLVAGPPPVTAGQVFTSASAVRALGLPGAIGQRFPTAAETP